MYRLLSALVLALLCSLPLRADTVMKKDYLEGKELLLIGVGSAVPLVLNYAVRDVDSTQKALIPRPIFADRWLQRKLGGSYHAGKTNWLDNTRGSAITPGIMGLALIAANFTWPEGKPGKDAGQDFLIFHSGLMATMGVTGIAKGLVARPRPFLYLYPDSLYKGDADMHQARKSFFSGHASSSFFSSTYLNKRLRTIMRHRLSGEDYSNWRWAPPLALFSWSSYVGWTRIHSYKHYFSDIVVGAAAGYLIAELFYSFGDKYSEEVIGSEAPISPIFHLSFTF
ncbi:MAG: phosphatase PAP2 family protein [Candidatus Zixiibacteriota bacterium]